jgi:hypothetical protein
VPSFRSSPYRLESCASSTSSVTPRAAAYEARSLRDAGQRRPGRADVDYGPAGLGFAHRLRQPGRRVHAQYDVYAFELPGEGFGVELRPAARHGQRRVRFYTRRKLGQDPAPLVAGGAYKGASVDDDDVRGLFVQRQLVPLGEELAHGRFGVDQVLGAPETYDGYRPVHGPYCSLTSTISTPGGTSNEKRLAGRPGLNLYAENRYDVQLRATS